MKPSRWLGLGLLLAACVFWHWWRGSREQGPSPPSQLARANPTTTACPPLLSVGALAYSDAVVCGSAAGAPARSLAPPSESPFSQFATWAEKYLAATDDGERARLLEKGRLLAQARRRALAEEIRLHPQRALELAASWRWRQALPPQISCLFETVVSGRGRLDVYCAYPLPGADYKEFQGTIRYATVGGVTYRAYVYGRRLRQMTRVGIPLHGIALDNLMAVAESPWRTLEPTEARAMLAAGMTVSNAGCPVCGGSTGGGDRPVLIESGGRHVGLCSRAHADEYNAALIAAEESPPQARLAGAGPTNLPPAEPMGSFGVKNLLYMRANFADDTTIPITEAEALDVMNQVNEYYVEASYNKTTIASAITPVLTLPKPKVRYGFEGPGAVHADAQAAAKAAGFDPANYDFLVVQHPSVPGFDWGGLGGGGSVWLQGSGVGITVHELGHCYGLPHANFWDTRHPDLPPNPNNLPFDPDSIIGHDSVIGAGLEIEYGDIFDVMGSGGGNSGKISPQNISAFDAHFNPLGKYSLGWLPEANVTHPACSSTNRVYVHDTPTLVEDRAYSLVAPKDGQRTYWISARSKFPGNSSVQNGVQLHWAPWQQSDGYSDLLDTTPGSKPGRVDSGVAVGRTYEDWEAGLFITPVARGGQGPDSWYDVVVNYGPFLSNAPPVMRLSASAETTPVGLPVAFQAQATDSDGDRLAYFWDFSDGSYAPSLPTATKSWVAAGDYVVKCEVSDMKGGVASTHLVVRVGTPTNAALRISGRVLDGNGLPLRNVRVHNGAIENNAIADSYQCAYTDSDGAYTLVNLDSGVCQVAAFLYGHVTRPLSFSTPISLVDKDATGVDFIAIPLPGVEVAAAADANKVSGAPGSFTLKRTNSDTNATLHAVFLLGGTASTNDFQIGAQTEQVTNVVPTPFGPKTNVYTFYYTDFATGVFATNITITPIPASPSGGPDKSVELTVMCPIQVTYVTLTNINDETVTNTNTVTYIDWQIVPVNGQDTWFLNDPPYVPRWPTDRALSLRDRPPNLPTVSIMAYNTAVSENTRDAGLFTILRFGKLDQAVTVRLQVGGSAIPGVDYEPLPSKVVIPAGQQSVRIPVYVKPDLYLDGAKTVEVTIEPSLAYKRGGATATVSITDNDPPLVTVAAVNPIALESGGQSGVLVVTRAGDLERPLTVQYLVTGTAVSGRDYRPLAGSVLIPAGQACATITVTPRNNGRRDGDLSVIVFLSDSPTYHIGTPNRATVVIQDSALPAIDVMATVASADKGGAPGEFTLTRSGDAGREVVVKYAAGGTARPHVDYTAIGETVRIPAGVRYVTITINALQHPFREDEETVVLQLLPSPDYNIGPQFQAVVTIPANDASLPGVGFNFRTSSAPQWAGEALIPVSVSGNPAENLDVTVDYEIVGGTAVAGIDYPTTSVTGRMVFPHGPDEGKNRFTNRTQIISIPITDHANAQPARTVILSLLEPAPAYLEQVVTNVEQDPDDPNISITNVVTNIVVSNIVMNALFDAYQTHIHTIIEDNGSEIGIEASDPVAREAGPKAGLFTISRRGPTNRAQVVNFQVSGTASNGSDYEAIPSSVTIPAGQLSVGVPVVPLVNLVREYTLDVTISLLSAPQARLGANSRATVYIYNDDGVIEFASTTYSTPENAGIVQIPIYRTSDTEAADTVDFSVGAGTAVPGVNFVATNGTVTFGPGESVQSIPVTVLDNGVVEETKTVLLTLLNPTGGGPLGGQSTAVLDITDTDLSVEFAAEGFLAYENATQAVIRVHRLGIPSNAFTVDMVVTNLAGANGIAQSGRDYVATNLTLAFVIGQVETNVQVTVLDNGLLDGDRDAALFLTNLVVADPVGGFSVGPRAAATLSILDEECTLQFSATEYQVDEYAKAAVLTVTRAGSTLNPVSVNYSTSDGTARAGFDYRKSQGTVSFTGDSYALAPDGSGQLELIPGEISKTVFIQIIDNLIGTGDLSFLVALSQPRGPAGDPNCALLGAVTNATVWITDSEMPGSVDYAYDPGQGADGPVLSVSVQPEDLGLGTPLYAGVFGGDFTRLDGVILNHIGRLHDDGYLDQGFDPGAGADGPVLAVAAQPDGRILIGGNFTQVSTRDAARIARLNRDGTLDDSFDAGGADAAVRAIGVHADGRIVIGGDFSLVGGLPRPGVARLNTDGSLDDSFEPRQGIEGGRVLAVAPLDDGKVIVAGDFAGVAGAGHPYLARLNVDGTLDTSFGAGSSPDAPVRAIAVQGDGRVVIGGDFATCGGRPRGRVARLHADGSLDTNFDPGSGADSAVLAVGIDPNGKILIGGAFTNVNGIDLNRLARLEANGSVDPDFKIGEGADDTIRALAVQPNSAILIGGDFTSFKHLPRTRVARIHGDEKIVVNKVQFSAPVYRVREDAGEGRITVRRSGDLNAAVTADYATSEGTAVEGVNYLPAQGTLRFLPGQSEAAFNVPVLDDGAAKGDVTVNLTLTNIVAPGGFTTNAQLTATLVILDKESTVFFDSAAQAVKKGTPVVEVTVVRSGSSLDTITVDYATRDGTAVEGLDYTGVSGTLTFAGRDSARVVDIPILDSGREDDVAFSVFLLNPQGGAVLGAVTNTVVTIINETAALYYRLSVAALLGGSVSPGSGNYPAGTNLTLTATPDAQYHFDHWTIVTDQGTAETPENPVALIMNQDYVVSATFRPAAATYTFEPPFGSSQLTSYPWSGAGNATWTLSSVTAREGRYALSSGPIGHNQESVLGLVVDSVGGVLSFDIRVSSERDWDTFEFLVDGARVRRWSGDVPWTLFQYNLGEGRHELCWRYSKDANFSAGLDAVFLDNIFVPTAAPRLFLTPRHPGLPALGLHGRTGVTYVTEASSDLLHWQPISTNLVTSGSVLIPDPDAAGQSARFYRARVH